MTVEKINLAQTWVLGRPNSYQKLLSSRCRQDELAHIQRRIEAKAPPGQSDASENDRCQHRRVLQLGPSRSGSCKAVGDVFGSWLLVFDFWLLLVVGSCCCSRRCCCPPRRRVYSPRQQSFGPPTYPVLFSLSICYSYTQNTHKTHQNRPLKKNKK